MANLTKKVDQKCKKCGGPIFLFTGRPGVCLPCKDEEREQDVHDAPVFLDQDIDLDRNLVMCYGLDAQRR